jgi:hypothetical protein
MRAPRAVDTEDQIAGVVKRVTASIDPAIPWDVVDAEVRRCFAQWTDAPVRDFIPSSPSGPSEPASGANVKQCDHARGQAPGPLRLRAPGLRPGTMLTYDLADQAVRVIGMGCAVEEACPGLRIPLEDWALDDPRGGSIEEVRKIRDDIKRRVDKLVADLG